MNTSPGKYRQITLFLLVSLLLPAVCLEGCGLLNRNSGQQNQQEQTDKIPKQLEEIESTIENIFLALGGPTGTAEIDSAQQGWQGQEENLESGQDQGASQGQGQEKPQDSTGEQQDSAAGQGEKASSGGQEATQDPWQKIAQEIQSLHYNWNEYLPEMTNKGAKKEVIEGFSDALNNLTKISQDQDKEKSLLAANQLYSHVPEIYSLYKTKSTPEIKSIIYFTRNTVLTSQTADWNQASADMEEIKSRWSIINNTLGQEQQSASAKLDLSLYELEKVIKDNDEDLVKIKGTLTLANIAELEKSMEQSSKQ